MMKAEDEFQDKLGKLQEKKLKVMQKVVILIAEVDAIDREIEELEKAEIERAGLLLIKQVVGESKGNTVIPDKPNLN
jgi:hypothetical protein